MSLMTWILIALAVYALLAWVTADRFDKDDPT
ncbi:hypothetical protein UFOVP150_67 [uncultured Caudovirales phage]|uniref:Uncharacterized protein n=1 Tax=uncultured Caudovirales phage TaxID=2100421 RepID=A0A6J7WE29_9CAUD|nr:hypothetical protein UFOVP150_67 [uncultured Caudovirales phage]